MIDLTVLLGQVGENAPSTSPQAGHWLLVFQWLMPLIGLVFFCLLFICVYRAAKFFDGAGKEQTLLRIEIGKLSEEVHLLRQEIKSDGNGVGLT